MITVILVVHLLLALGLVGVVLLQRSEGGALGMGGGGMSGFLTGRSTANLLTRTTAILAVLFFLTSLTLARLAGVHRGSHSLFEDAVPGSIEQTVPAPQDQQPAQPAEPAPPIAR